MVNDLSKIGDKTFDFIMCCGVFEHVSNPLEVLNKLRKLSHRDTFLYFEVPIDSPFIFKITSLKTLIKRILLVNVSLYNIFHKISTTVDKSYVRIPSVFYMHEHLNHFSIRSMSNMLISNGFDIKYIASKEIDFGWNTTNLLSCLAKLHQADSDGSSDNINLLKD